MASMGVFDFLQDVMFLKYLQVYVSPSTQKQLYTSGAIRCTEVITLP